MNHSSKSKAALLAGLLLLLALVVVGSRRGDRSGLENDQVTSVERGGRVSESHGDDQDSPNLAGEAEDKSGSVAAPSHTHVAPEQRALVTKPTLSARLVDETGEGVQGARVSWTSFHSTWLLPLSGWQDLDPRWADEGWIEERTVHALSDGDGNFEFVDPPVSIEEKDSVIWITHEEHRAKALLLTPGMPEPIASQIVLSSAMALRVRVVDGSNRGVPDAVVSQWAVVEPAKQKGAQQPLEKAVRLFLRRSASADAEGWVSLPYIPDSVGLQASSGELLTEEWEGPPRPELYLHLLPTFTASGELTLSDGYEPHPDENSVLIEGWASGTPHPLGRVNFPSGSLEWGPVAVPIGKYSTFSFHLKSFRVTETTKRIPAPEPGAQVVVNFEGVRGNTIWFGLVDGLNQPIKQGLVEVFWEDELGTQSVAMKLMADGYTSSGIIPTGQISSWRGSAPGFAANHLAGFGVPEVSPGTHMMTLAPAGRVRGRCVADGEPVADFEVILFETEDPGKISRKRFFGNSDGFFVIDEAPLGEVQILASAAGYAPSTANHITVTDQEPAEVLLILSDPRQVQGTVVDELGEPISGATVQASIGNGRQLLMPRGALTQTDFRGEFSLKEMPAGRSGLVVKARGYSSVEKWLRIDSEATTDVGILRMRPLRALHVRVIPAGAIDLTQCQFSINIDGANRTPFRSLSPSGEAVFEGVNVDTRNAYLVLPDGSFIGLRVPKPVGREWTAEYHIGGTGGAIIDLDRTTHEGALAPNLLVNLDSYARGKASFVRAMTIPAKGEAVFHGLAPGNYLARVSDTSTSTPGSTVFSVSEGEVTRASIRFDGQASVFRVVDKEGAPLSGVTLSLYDSVYPLWRQAVSDDDGLCTISGSPPIDCFAGLQHSEFGDLWGLPVALGRGLQTITELEFSANCAIRLKLADGVTPLGQVECRLKAADNREVGVGFPRESDASGYLAFEHLGPATYSAEFQGNGIWPTQQLLEASENAAPQTIKLRRVADLKFTVTTASGAGIEGVYIRLESLDLNQAAEQWISEGKLLTSPASTTTDPTGHLTFPAIPRGSYRWTALHGGIELVSGLTELVAGTKHVIPVELP